MKICYVTLRFPYPPLKGDQVVSYSRIKYLSKNNSITLLSLVEDNISEHDYEEVRKYCEDIIVVKFSKFQAAFSLLRYIVEYPLQVSVYLQSKFIRAFRSLLASQDFDVVHLSLLRSAFLIQYIERTPILLDMIDSMKLNFSQLSRGRHNVFRRLVYKFESIKLARFEPYIIDKVDAAILVSNIDKLFIDSPRKNIYVIPNGVDYNVFRPIDRKYTIFTIAFSGKLDYWPNVEAVLWFAKVFKRLKLKYKEIQFMVIGGGWHPSLEVLRLESGIEFTGFVDDLSAYLAMSHMAVAPMQSGSGMQNKVLEAMSCGLPLILTNMARGDIKIIDGEHALIADSHEEFYCKCCLVLDDFDNFVKIGESARQFIQQYHSWDSVAKKICSVYEDIIE